MLCCAVAVIFLIAMLYMCVLSPLILDEDKHSVMKQLKDTLTIEQQNTHTRIVKERMGIHMRGYGYGLVLSALILYYKMTSKSKKLTPNMMVCVTASVTFLTNYFYYILSPKKEWMVTTLVTQQQKEAWLKMYRHMQYNYHIGFLLGILAVVFMTKGVLCDSK